MSGRGGTAKSAVEQMREKGYAEKYVTEFAEIYLIGVEFDERERNVAAFEWERWER